MKRMLQNTFASVVSAMIAIVAANVSAQTVANGPYYATPSWDQTLPAATRFIVLSNFASQAVLDRETGLVWQRTPQEATTTWASAISTCRQLVVGARSGWRLPTAYELRTLLDATQSNPALPVGHPFIGVRFHIDLLASPQILNGYWSTTRANNSEEIIVVITFDNINSNITVNRNAIFYEELRPWCVRGGFGADRI